MSLQSAMKDEIGMYVIIALLAAVWIFIRRNASPYTVSAALFELMICWLLYSTGEYVVWQARYRMPQVVVNGLSGSVGERPVIIGEYAVFGLGEAYDPVHIPGKLATLVVPVKNLYQFGQNWASATFVYPLPAIKLPPEVYSFLMHSGNKYNLDKCYFGLFSEDFLLKHKDELPQYEVERENLWAAINLRDRHIEGDDDLLIEKVHTGKELSGKKSGLELIFGKKEAPPSE